MYGRNEIEMAFSSDTCVTTSNIVLHRGPKYLTERWDLEGSDPPPVKIYVEALGRTYSDAA